MQIQTTYKTVHCLLSTAHCFLLRAWPNKCDYSSMEICILPANLELPDLLDAEGRLKLLPAAAYDAISRNAVRLWCHNFARYGLPTIELVNWLKARIAGHTAIEIGSGAGDLAFHLGIPATDNRMQEWPMIKFNYTMTGQPVIQYPDFVQELDALTAVAQYQPDVVIASWVTQWIDPDLPPPETGGNVWGIKEDEILATGCTYILIGNQKVHGDKKIMAAPHEEFVLPFLRSRANYPALDRVWVWNA